MLYTTQSEIQTKIPAQHLNDALDDDGDGAADTSILDTIIAVAGNDVDGYLAGIFTVPINPTPAVCQAAALVFACEAIYDRRQITDKNPWKDRADSWRTRLEKIGNGELPLDAATEKEFTPGAAIVEDVDTDGSMR